MKKDKFLVLTRSDIEPLIGLKEAIPVVEKAFQDFAIGKSSIFPVFREEIEPFGGFFGVKAGYLASQSYLGYNRHSFLSSNNKGGVGSSRDAH